MKVISTPLAIQKICLQLRKKNRTIAFVPTMGFLHDGHLQLLKQAKKIADVVVLSIFVNPKQFGPKEDLSRYPRDLKGDLKKAKSVGVDFVFTPTESDLYPNGFETFVEVTKATSELCGATRPGHFRGVTTIVAKLFLIVQPHIALFGQKDFQQLAVIRRMVTDLNFPIKIIGVPTKREKDGLAMSSRNVYLSADERTAALALSRSLKKVATVAKNKQVPLTTLLKIIKDEIANQPLLKIDYIKAVDAETILPLTQYQPRRTLIALAIFAGKTRLIDNVVV